MNKTFAILHLSDLHIVPHHNNTYSIVLNRMIDHIVNITKDIDRLIIVFTGDLVERGNFDKCSYNYNQFLEGFK